MRILVLGANGMLGHKVFQTLSEFGYDAAGTVRRELESGSVGTFLRRYGAVFENVDAKDVGSVTSSLVLFRPQVVINAIGVIKQRSESTDPLQSISVNSLLPHHVATWCADNDCRFIHFSTDCVFSGSRGNYTEDDVSDAADLYGRTKFLGEVGPPALTLRTSIVGRELSNFGSLVEWFLSQRGKTVQGFKRALYSGVTTLEASRIVTRLIEEHPGLDGLYHLAGPQITKFDLLKEIRDQMNLDIEMIPDTDFVIDRTLVGDRLVNETEIRPPSWERMIREMVNDPTPYEDLR